MRRRDPPLDLDWATRRVTAFRDFDDLVSDIRRTGYVPTLQIGVRGGGEREAVIMLREALHKRGLRVYPQWGYYNE